MNENKQKAYEILHKAFPNYTVGIGVLKEVGHKAASFGLKTLVICNDSAHQMALYEKCKKYLEDANVKILGSRPCLGARPNAPKEDVYRIACHILAHRPDSIIAIGGGSTIDAVKAACTLASLGDVKSCEIDSYFGTGVVSSALEENKRKLLPIIAVQTSSSSGAHLTKYSNITDLTTGQKKLIVDDAIVPSSPLFDYSLTTSMPPRVTVDGALDSISHTVEVFWGAKGEKYEKAEQLFTAAASLTTAYAKKAITKGEDLEAREALGLSTDLGGYAIMVGGTSGGHLTSFSLVDCIGHGTACGIMNPYYAVLFGRAIQKQLHTVGNVFKKAGFGKEYDFDKLEGRELSEAVAKAMLSFNASLGAPTKLSDIPAFREEIHIPRAINAAKDPALKMKLQNMPVPMKSEDVDEYMLPLLKAASSGDISLIKEM
ncbi:MAG: iron-containing alcohol dehydrogenase [Sphaerochaetaceae bacterium]|nr:iron-containing alcohol dehydrogenase [Sphaerochaetaceae bacterium]